MQKHVPILKEINGFGYITNNSQAGRHFKGVNTETKKRYNYSEKAYINGFMLQSKAVLFIKAISLYTDKLAQVVHPTTDQATLELTSALDVPLTIDMISGDVHTHMPNTVSLAQRMTHRQN